MAMPAPIGIIGPAAQPFQSLSKSISLFDINIAPVDVAGVDAIAAPDVGAVTTRPGSCEGRSQARPFRHWALTRSDTWALTRPGSGTLAGRGSLRCAHPTATVHPRRGHLACAHASCPDVGGWPAVAAAGRAAIAAAATAEARASGAGTAEAASTAATPSAEATSATTTAAAESTAAAAAHAHRAAAARAAATAAGIGPGR